MSNYVLASKLNDIMLSICPYDYADNEYSIEKAKEDIVKNPGVVINELIDIIEMLTD